MTRPKQTDAAERWQQEIAKAAPRPRPPTTVSGTPIEPLYMPDDFPNGSDDETLGYPGQYPFTRGIHASMYRGRLWTMRQFAGFGTPEQTNQRFRFLVEKGQTGLSTAFDLPTLMGLDSDDQRSLGEVGRLGVAVDTLDDERKTAEKYGPSPRREQDIAFWEQKVEELSRAIQETQDELDSYSVTE